jgi:hypothetical protein
LNQVLNSLATIGACLNKMATLILIVLDKPNVYPTPELNRYTMSISRAIKYGFEVQNWIIRSGNPECQDEQLWAWSDVRTRSAFAIKV